MNKILSILMLSASVALAGINTGGGSSSGGSQTPWTSDINGGSHSLTNVSGITSPSGDTQPIAADTNALVIPSTSATIAAGLAGRYVYSVCSVGYIPQGADPNTCDLGATGGIPITPGQGYVRNSSGDIAATNILGDTVLIVAGSVCNMSDNSGSFTVLQGTKSVAAKFEAVDGSNSTNSLTPLGLTFNSNGNQFNVLNDGGSFTITNVSGDNGYWRMDTEGGTHFSGQLNVDNGNSIVGSGSGGVISGFVLDATALNGAIPRPIQYVTNIIPSGASLIIKTITGTNYTVFGTHSP